MKKIIILFMILLVGCNEVKEVENNDSTVQEEILDDIPMKMEQVLREENETKEISIESVLAEIAEEQTSIVDTIVKKQYSDDELKRLIGNMFIVGFYGTSITKNSQIVKDIQNYNLGGVILFDKHPSKKGKAKNIKTPQQLKTLTDKLQKFSEHKLFIATDQEGGKVARLKKRTGFKNNYPSAKDIGSKYKLASVQKIYEGMAEALIGAGINLNFAPSVDMEINPRNVVIVKLERSFGKDSKRVVMFSKIFIEAMNSHGVMTSLKHFPGHGSSLGDSHKGFVDITKSWQERELEPYKKLISENLVDTVMVAHVFHKDMDNQYPASLSHKIVTEKLRKELGYEGVVITDDLQMRAISEHYSLEETIQNSINAGVDILLFGNQLDPKQIVSVKELIDITFLLLKNGDIDIKTIEDANHRINILRSNY